MFQMASFGPIQGQAYYFIRMAPEQVPYGIKRYTEETKRFYAVLNGALEGKEYLVGNKFTLADATNFPFVRVHFMCGIPTLDDYPNLKAWISRINERPAIQKGLNVPDPDKLKEYMEKSTSSN